MPVAFHPVQASDHIALRAGARSTTRGSGAGRAWAARWHWAVAVPLAVVGVGAVGPTTASIPLLYLAAISPELVRVDLREHRLPNALTLPGIVLGAAACALQTLSTGRVELAPIMAGLCYTGLLLVLWLLGGMGLGDVKLGAALGFASWIPFVGVLSPVVAFLAGGVGSIAVLVSRGRGARMAFGPYLIGGFWCAVGLVAFARL